MSISESAVAVADSAVDHSGCRTAPIQHHPTWSDSPNPWRLDTVLAHAGTATDPVTGAITTPIHLSTAFGHPGLGASTGYDYTRTASPTRDVLQDALARLDGGAAGFALASGMAAVQLTVTTLAPYGSRIVALEDLYGGTYRYLKCLADDGAYEVDFVVGEAGLREALRRPAALVLIETPTNPMMTELDIARVADWAHAAGALLAVDNTFYTPVICRPLELGADVAVYSATKYLAGHNDVMAGAVVVNDPALGERLQYQLNTTGATLGPFDAFLLLRGLKTLSLRMERHEANARKVADFLRTDTRVTRVLYPGRSGMVSFELADGVDVAAFLAAVRVFTFAESLGGVESLVTCPSVQTHADVPPSTRAAYGLTDRLLRLSVGIEDAADLLADLRQALDRAGAEAA
ncbi:MAG: methionine biosynthesis PLP-dependent protein [Actinomyces ruminicola]|uniref:homocysteine desulfhydrase n=1 Tax=Actinomyces succiniciruminis TaxID=1522002 RepID=A0A1L7R9G1_9ACTO|nr:PLP-dependent transferase [Actinomyces succiniciruminis]MBE6474782.1 methionine biosynthesis PLP-dependent protein [Actinomyces succiniciruminis]MBE6481148.1 methionine biosynthesis PLP-dependent protein [Actinomyces ruminicola]CED90477.1 Cystathionine gamma-synthase/O-acetylhomoserine (thiol)-lyase [Actinomyces succiniciruminis]